MLPAFALDDQKPTKLPSFFTLKYPLKIVNVAGKNEN